MAIDKTRASRDGHQFHEAWLARQALALVLSSSELHGIAVEGLAVDDEEQSSDAAVEIADATFYYGGGASFEACTRVEIAQFKYSIASNDKPLRVSDARKTLAKFAAAEVDFVAKYGSDLASAKLGYSLNTNRPIAEGMVEALHAAATGETPTSTSSQTQLEQLRDSTKLTGDLLRSFAARIRLVGRMERLRETERGNALPDSGASRSPSERRGDSSFAPPTSRRPPHSAHVAVGGQRQSPRGQTAHTGR